MNRTTLPLNEILVPERFRKDYGDLSDLKASILHIGLIQPIVVTQDKVLVAGGRRHRACTELKLESIDVSYKEALSEADRQEMELVENVIRKNFTWQEEALAILTIHRKRQLEADLNSTTWNQRMACALFGVSMGALGYVLDVAKRLEGELKLPEDQRKYHGFQSCNEAYRIGILSEIEAKALAELKKRHVAIAQTVAPPTLEVIEAIKEVDLFDQRPDLLIEARDRYYKNPHNKPDSFEAYWKSRQEMKQEFENTIHLSPRLLHTDCIEYMKANPNSCDHIITDIPYAIDMENLNQQNIHGGLQDLERVDKLHDVDENIALIDTFFEAAFIHTCEKAFVITYCDIMQWNFMYDLASDAGFAVQRWPVIWHKQSGGMNQCASYNTTKNYDIIMVCRKPGATLRTPITSSIILASHESARIECKHPFSKPFEVTRILADAISTKGQRFFEPFAGGGSIAIELMRQERNVIAAEKDEHWYNTLLENVKQFYLKINPQTKFK